MSNPRRARRRCVPRPTRLLLKEGLIDALNAKINQAKAEDLANRTAIEHKRLEVAEQTLKSQLAVQEAEVKRLRTTFELRRQELDKLKVRAGINGVLQVVPVEVGAQMAAGAERRPRRRPHSPESRAPHPGNTDQGRRDRPDRPEIDTRNGVVQGKVSRIDAAATNGTVTVDVVPRWRAPARRPSRPHGRRHGRSSSGWRTSSSSAGRRSGRKTARSPCSR